jgi:hypothetical protein
MKNGILESCSPKRLIFALAVALAELQRTMAEIACRQCDTDDSLGASPQVARVLNTDPACEWLRSSSRIMTYVYDLLATQDITNTDAATVRVAVERLLASAPGRFPERYLEAVGREPAVALAYVRLRDALEATAIAIRR